MQYLHYLEGEKKAVEELSKFNYKITGILKKIKKWKKLQNFQVKKIYIKICEMTIYPHETIPPPF